MKIKFILILLFSVSVINAQFEQEIDVSDAISAGLDLRTAGVVIAKELVYKSLKSKIIEKEVDNNLSKGEKALLTLEIYSNKYPEIRDDFNIVKSYWKKNRNMAISTPNKSMFTKLTKVLNHYLTITNKLIDEIKHTHNITTLNYQQSTNEMELLAQQLTLLYAMQVADIHNASLKHEMNNCKINFQKNLDKTFFSGENTIEVSDALKKIQADWELSKRTLDKNGQEQLLNTLYVMMNKISKQSRKAADFYQKMAKQKLKK